MRDDPDIRRIGVKLEKMYMFFKKKVLLRFAF